MTINTNYATEGAAIKAALGKAEPQAKKQICSEKTLQIFSGLGKEPTAVKSVQGRAKTVEQMTAQLKEPRKMKTAMNIFNALMTALFIAVAVTVMVFAVPAIGLGLSIFLGLVLGSAAISRIADAVKGFREIPNLRAQLKAKEKMQDVNFFKARKYFEKNHDALLRGINEEMRLRQDANPKDEDLQQIHVSRLKDLEKAREELDAANAHYRMHAPIRV